MNDLYGLGLFIKSKLNFLNNWADFLNLRIRIPLARSVAKNLILPILSNDDNKGKGVLKIIGVAIELFILYSFMTVYVIPILIPVKLGIKSSTLMTSIVTIAILLIFEEEYRFLRKVSQALDERVGLNPFDTSKTFMFITKYAVFEKVVFTILAGVTAAFIMQLGAAYDAAHVPNTSENVKALSQIAKLHPMLLSMITLFLAPVIEEYFFRGIVLRIPIISIKNYDYLKDNRIANLLATIVGMLLSSLLFAVAHEPNTLGYGLALFASGSILSFLVIKTGRMRYNICAHMLINATPFIISIITQIF